MGTTFLYIIFFALIILVVTSTSAPPSKPPESLDDKLIKTIRSIVIDELNKRLK